MKAVCWMGKQSIEVHDVDDPKIINPHDAIIKVTRTAICGSDLHLYAGLIPSMESGDILGHEFMGIVEEIGTEVKRLKPGDRVVIPFTIACGSCLFCKSDLWSLCDNTNPNAHVAETMYGYSGSALFGYSHIYGGYAGGQAQYARVPFADVGPIKIENDLPDEKVLFLSDIFPTGYQGAVNANIKQGDTVAVWGCGPVGLFAIASAYMLGAEKVIAIDRFPERLKLARGCGATTIDYSQDKVSIVEALRDLSGGIGPDSCIDCVGIEAHSHSAGGIYDKVKQTLKLETDRPFVLRQAIQAIRKGGTLSIPGVYGGVLDKVNFGAAFGKGIHMSMGQTHMHKFLKPLLEHIEQGHIDPSFLISHRIGIEQAPEMYFKWQKKEDGVTKIVIDPWRDTIGAETRARVA
ncbi:zinc-dependent alcohol dehydrogenase [Tunturiibacter lichenicola]|uniref:zinc-dependent alcohol dehydrogenase n=1 Tax=Tunturiibacter lichenicola TaxID=2051959 RepID=UPI003D9B64AD